MIPHIQTLGGAYKVEGRNLRRRRRCRRYFETDWPRRARATAKTRGSCSYTGAAHLSESSHRLRQNRFPLNHGSLYDLDPQETRIGYGSGIGRSNEPLDFESRVGLRPGLTSPSLSFSGVPGEKAASRGNVTANQGAQELGRHARPLLFLNPAPAGSRAGSRACTDCRIGF